jgi:hypothetical protein
MTEEVLAAAVERHHGTQTPDVSRETVVSVSQENLLCSLQSSLKSTYVFAGTHVGIVYLHKA